MASAIDQPSTDTRAGRNRKLGEVDPQLADRRRFVVHRDTAGMSIVSDILRMLSDQFVVSFSGTNNDASSPLVLKFDRYVYWLETKLLSTSHDELHELDDTLDILMDRTALLKNMSTQCRASMIVYNSAQTNRIYKMFEQIDALEEPYIVGRLFVSSGDQPVSSLLPDFDILSEIVGKYRSKLKAIDEIAASKKNDAIKFKSTKTVTSSRGDTKRAADIPSIRSEVRSILLLLDKLAAESQSKSSILRYFGQIKQWVHFPLQSLSFKLRSLPSLNEASGHVQREHDALHRADDQYNTARRADILAAAAQAFREACYIENTAEDSLSAVRLLGNDEVYQVLCQVCSDDSPTLIHQDSIADEMEMDSGVPAWLYNLRRMAEQPTASVLSICASK
jgi:hypothetical protein